MILPSGMVSHCARPVAQYLIGLCCYVLSAGCWGAQDITMVLERNNSGDVVVAVRDLANSEILTAEKLQTLKGLWDLDKSKHPSWKWDEIIQPHARVWVAAGLLRAKRMGVKNLDVEPVYQYVMKQLDQNDPVIKGSAILALAYAEDDRPVSSLRDIVRSESHLARAAVVTLYAIGSDRARATLRELEQSVKDKDLKDYIGAVRANVPRKQLELLGTKQPTSRAKPPVNPIVGDNAESNSIALLQIADIDFLKNTAIEYLSKNLLDPNVFNLLNDVWHENRQKYPNFAWEQIRRPVVRLNIARLLGNAQRLQRFRGVEIQSETRMEIRSYIHSHLSDQAVEVRAAAAFALGSVADSRDIEVLKRIVIQDLPIVGKNAVRSIGGFQNNEAKVALQELEKTVADQQLKSVIRHTLSIWKEN